MGEIRDYHCSCGYERRLFIGGGRNGINLSIIEHSFPAGFIKDFKKEKEAGNVEGYLMEHAVIECSDCKEIYTVPYFHYHLKDGGQRQYISPCPSCEGRGRILQEIDKISCPRCGALMEYESVGNWD